MKAPRSAEHVVYRCYGAGQILYIGVTCDPSQRLRAHRYSSPWYAEVDRVEYEVHPDRAAAFAAEADAIHNERPLHNMRGTERYPVPYEEHGYAGYATRGCRCEICKRGKADYMRERRAEARAKAQPGVAVAGVAHGTRVAYEEHGCRCQPCRAKKNATRREEQQRAALRAANVRAAA